MQTLVRLIMHVFVSLHMFQSLFWRLDVAVSDRPVISSLTIG